MNELLFVGIALAVFITSFVMSKENKKLNEKILILWIIFLALPLLSRAINRDGLDLQLVIFQAHLIYPLTFGPFLLLYVKSLVGDRQKLKAIDFLHFLPFVFFSLYQYLIIKAPIFVEAGDNISVTIDHTTEWIVLGSLVVYTVLVGRRLHRHNNEVVDHFSILHTHVTLRWLTRVTVAFVIACLLPLTAPIISLPVIFQSHAFAYTGFIFILGFFGLKQTQVFIETKTEEGSSDIEIDRSLSDTSTLDRVKSRHDDDLEGLVSVATELPIKITNSEPNKNSKYKNSGLTQQRAEEYLERLEDYFQKKQPYLDPNLTIDKLAKQISIPRHYLTQVINEQLNKNFYLYVNEYRINVVKEILCDPRSKKMTMLEVAYESGFNSKSTFNTVFKKITDVTPSNYQKLVNQI